MLWAEVGISVLIICKFSNEWTCTRKKNVEGFGCGFENLYNLATVSLVLTMAKYRSYIDDVMLSS